MALSCDASDRVVRQNELDRRSAYATRRPTCCALRYMLNSLRATWGAWAGALVNLTLVVRDPIAVGRCGGRQRPRALELTDCPGQAASQALSEGGDEPLDVQSSSFALHPQPIKFEALLSRPNWWSRWLGLRESDGQGMTLPSDQAVELLPSVDRATRRRGVRSQSRKRTHSRTVRPATV